MELMAWAAIPLTFDCVQSEGHRLEKERSVEGYIVQKAACL